MRPSSIYLETKVFMGFLIIRSFADVMVPFSAIRSAAKKRDQTDEEQGGCARVQVFFRIYVQGSGFGNGVQCLLHALQ